MSLQHFSRARVVVVHATNSGGVGGRECRRHLHVVVSFFTLLPSIKSVYCEVSARSKDNSMKKLSDDSSGGTTVY